MGVRSGEEPLFYGCVSSNRPGNVARVQGIFGPTVNWYVPSEQVGDYQYAGAHRVTAADGPLGTCRNLMLDDAFALGLPIVMSDDDPQRFLHIARKTVHGKVKFIRTPITPGAAIAEFLRRLRATGYFMAGGPAHNNPFFTKPYDQIDAPVQGTFTVHLPNPVRYDPRLRLKEDLEVSLAHIHHHGGVLRINDILPVYEHQLNRGGCQDYRREELEAEMGALIGQKWGHVFTGARWTRHYGGSYGANHDADREAYLQKRARAEGLQL